MDANMKFIITLCLLLFGFSGQCFADNFEKGNTAYTHKNYEMAYKLLLPLADAGNANAQVIIGKIYSNCLSVECDNMKAIKYWALASENGNARAAKEIAEMYKSGIAEGKQNEAAATRWFRKAAELYRVQAELGVADSEFSLGLLYGQGNGVSQNRDKQLEWFRKAVEHGDVSAAFALGLYYQTPGFFGIGVDIEESNRWYKKGIDHARKYVQAGDWNMASALSTSYMQGVGGLEQSVEKAYFWAKIAEAYGDYIAEIQARTVAQKIPATKKSELDKLVAEWKNKHPYVPRKQTNFWPMP
ncbi:MAG: sel1 repeat family protein [Alphaproteobacteria bacterium]|nr:sel1 repeat family protein [Alphaproteobacteria bacterium]